MKKAYSTKRSSFLYPNKSIKAINSHNDEEQNKNCFDCGRNNPEFISINNGIFICELCVENHLTLGEDISLIINNDFNLISKKELLHMYYGGNKRLYKFITNEFPSLRNCPRHKLYKTKALDYYRKRLNYYIEGGKEPTKPKINEVLEVIQEKEINAPYLNNSFEENKKEKNNNDLNTNIHSRNNSIDLYYKHYDTENTNNNSNDSENIDNNPNTLNLKSHHINSNKSFKKGKNLNFKNIYYKPKINDLNKQKNNKNNIFKRTFAYNLSNKKKLKINSQKEINTHNTTQSFKLYRNYIDNSKNNSINYNINNYFSSSNLNNNSSSKHKIINFRESDRTKFNKCNISKKSKTNFISNENNYITKRNLCFYRNNKYNNKEKVRNETKKLNEKQKSKTIKEIIIKPKNSEKIFNTNRNTDDISDNTNDTKRVSEKYKSNKKSGIKDIEINFRKSSLLFFNDSDSSKLGHLNCSEPTEKFKDIKFNEVRFDKNINLEIKLNEEISDNSKHKKLQKIKAINVNTYNKLLTEVNPQRTISDKNKNINFVSPSKIYSKQNLVYVKTHTQYTALKSNKKQFPFILSPQNGIYYSNQKKNKLPFLSLRYKNRSIKNNFNKTLNLMIEKEDNDTNLIKKFYIIRLKRKHIHSVPRKRKKK